jgi:hypothetical protein
MQKLESLPSKTQKHSSHDLLAHHSLFIFPFVSLIEQGLTASGREQQGSRGGSTMNKLPLQEQLHATFPGRARQIDQILGYMGEVCRPRFDMDESCKNPLLIECDGFLCQW